MKRGKVPQRVGLAPPAPGLPRHVPSRPWMSWRPLSPETCTSWLETIHVQTLDVFTTLGIKRISPHLNDEAASSAIYLMLVHPIKDARAKLECGCQAWRISLYHPTSKRKPSWHCLVPWTSTGVTFEVDMKPATLLRCNSWSRSSYSRYLSTKVNTRLATDIPNINTTHPSAHLLHRLSAISASTAQCPHFE